MSRPFGILFLSIIFLTLFSSWASADLPHYTRNEFAIKFGYYGNGTISIDKSDMETRPDIMFGINLDCSVYKWLYFGALIDIARIKATSSIKEPFLHLGLALKFKAPLKNKNFDIKYGFALGYGFLNEIGGFDNSEYTTTQVTLEFLYRAHKRIGIVNEIGFLWAISGGNDTTDVTGGPFLLYRAGILF